uniref:receptor protein serine/threonine kinase n=1 Tax=Acanthochromis polyacanthus TaxID=80966 RepID=A0A3Q1EW03_9TELE
QVMSQNYDKYTTAGNVNGSVQVCENTQCCVGCYLIVNACDMVEKSCPSATCEAQSRFNNRFLKCVCNTDFCNGNITWTPESEEPPHTYSYSPSNPQCANYWLAFTSGCDSLPVCSCISQIVGQGHFATVFQGKYKGSVVAVKVLPPDWKVKFTTEKEIFELPLMTHAGIVHFLGTGRKPDDNSCFIVLQFAEYGSLHSFLCKHTTSWMSSLKLCHSLSQGLSYLHSDLHNGHKPPVAHSDLSSSNVLVRADGTCVLCDFGCSTILRSRSDYMYFALILINYQFTFL